MDILYKAAKINKQNEEEHKDSYKRKSKERLCKIMKKKMTTALIGSLARFEKFFGELWGQNSSNKNEEQVQLYKKLWDICRNEILTHGNNQLRALENELTEYDINWNRHSIVLKEKGTENE